ncbi:MAG: B12-binding domain-containing protein [Methanomassiliicoccaceae archaeon]|nr:B12-binding domain-containing protein [Methanomassiliicoccaceae archaeon]
MADEVLIQWAKRSVIEYSTRDAVAVAKEAISNGKTDLKRLIQEGFAAGMVEIGERYNRNEIYLPHVMASSLATKHAMKVLEPELYKIKDTLESKGKIVICTPQGDIHSIGKDIVATMLSIAGFDMIDLGSDVDLEKIVKSTVDNGALAICTSASMTTTMFSQKHLESLLLKKGLRDQVITNVGGAPVTQAWADEIGADLYSQNAEDAVNKFLSLLGE